MNSTSEKYPWELNLAGLVGENEEQKFQELRNLVDKRRRLACCCKICLNIGFFLILVILIAVLWLLEIFSPESRTDLIDGIIAFALIIFIFLSPYLPRLQSEDIEGVLKTKIPDAIMRQIQSYVSSISEDIVRWLTLIGAIGIIATLIIKVCKGS